ncbi:hypothetical protein CDAR_273721 [Caerostris darwini]|uniref:G-patch domain-containing protein n=1 Tax=Caerostris darwini TaxID=1538125 RepID=A0AAV4W5U9_9ARAC|nr:hypothetical protein CDAR_273721 [Caerostris darwini]
MSHLGNLGGNVFEDMLSLEPDTHNFCSKQRTFIEMCSVKIGRIGAFDYNPRGNLWTNDECSFGHTMLAKMGWSRGKGLGKNENGITENLKVNIRNGNTGVGFKETLIGIDTREYDNVLENLNKRYGKSDKVKSENRSIEVRSQQFKNRLHYGKFVKGKDISRYSAKDLDCIFLNTPKTEEMEDSSETPVVKEESTDSNKDSMPIFKSQHTMADYFAEKLRQKSAKLSKGSLNSTEVQNEEKFDSDHQLKIKKEIKREIKNDTKLKKQKLTELHTRNDDRNSSEDDVAIVEVFSKVNNSAEKKNSIKSSKKRKKIKEEQCKESSSSTEEIQSIELCDTKAETSSKKRKKDLKNSKKAKRLKLSEPENSDVFDERTEKAFANLVNKKIKLNLKSCLRKSATTLWFNQIPKTVSFKENASFKIIPSRFSNEESELNGVLQEASEQLYPCDSTNCENDEKEVDKKLNPSTNPCEVEDESENAEINDDKISESSEEINSNNNEKLPECFQLPKNDSSHYDSWRENQMLAVRMKIYKNMAKKLKKHPILGKTNLLSIKGYGNWGL